jgi:hypothetical protein
MKIGLVGESPHDTASVKNLLERVYKEVEFVNLIEDIRGSQLDQMQPTKRILRIEYQDHKPDLVIFIRDLDGLITDREKLAKRFEYFREFRSVVDKKAIYMLNIFEIEALILCDLNAFQEHYSCQCTCNEDPHSVENPKEYLRLLNKHYREVDNADIFAKIEHSELLVKSRYYKQFVDRLDKAVSA